MAQIITTLTITHAEVLDILKVHFNLRDDTQVTITDQDDHQDADGWIEVNPSWEGDCPASANQFDRIEVRLRNGTQDFGRPDRWTLAWCQDGNPYDIIQFRPA